MIPISSINYREFSLTSGYEILKFMMGITKDFISIVKIKIETTQFIRHN